ncbi:transposase DNA-binding-containing protein [Legionella sainthelensi]|uniref:transposase DNA-binding-containing protein n=1 Tax=Legionella sainthelensi TaxID=28087 RepID=UPI000E20252F|nr:transposase DNA-binding-containing protein [Legionella sainthelensi]
MSWAVEEMRTVNLGDKRLHKRFLIRSYLKIDTIAANALINAHLLAFFEDLKLSASSTRIYNST